MDARTLSNTARKGAQVSENSSARMSLPRNLMNVTWAPCTFSIAASSTEASTTYGHTGFTCFLVAAREEGFGKRLVWEGCALGITSLKIDRNLSWVTTGLVLHPYVAAVQPLGHSWHSPCPHALFLVPLVDQSLAGYMDPLSPMYETDGFVG